VCAIWYSRIACSTTLVIKSATSWGDLLTVRWIGQTAIENDVPCTVGSVAADATNRLVIRWPLLRPWSIVYPVLSRRFDGRAITKTLGSVHGLQNRLLPTISRLRGENHGSAPIVDFTSYQLCRSRHEELQTEFVVSLIDALQALRGYRAIRYESSKRLSICNVAPAVMMPVAFPAKPACADEFHSTSARPSAARPTV